MAKDKNAVKEEVVKEINLDEVEVEEKEVTVMDMLNRIVVCLVVIAIILAVNTVILLCKDNTSVKKPSTESTKTTETESGSSNPNYDVSMMDEVTVTQALDLFKGDDTYVLYIGRETCGACVSYLPSLQQAQENLGYTTKYLDITKIDSNDANLDKFLEKLSKKYTMNANGQEQTETFGYWFGYTPMTVIIQKGKMVDGEIGAIGYDKLVEMLNKYDIGK